MVRKIALVGIGKIAVDQHVPAIEASVDWELAATVSRNGSVDGVQAFTDIGTMLSKRPDIEAVSLCVPPGPRFAFASASIDAGRHLMLEKPPGASISECRQLELMAAQAGVSVYATWHSREAEFVDAARDWLADKTIQRFEITWIESVRKWHPGQDWVFEPAGMGVFDPGINALSILTKILPVPVRIQGAVLEFPVNRKTPIAAEIGFTGPGMRASRAIFDWRPEDRQTWTIEVDTPQGVLKLLDGGARLEIDGTLQSGSSANSLNSEYPRLYARMAQLIDEAGSEMDLRPFELLADAYLCGEHKTIDAFEW